MLLRLLSRYLKPYWYLLVLVLLLDFGSAFATLYLPSLNADIINNGVAKGDIPYIWATGGWMLLVALGQITANVLGVLCASLAAMRAGRDIRNGVFSKVSGFSEQEVSRFGAGSLITRNTNDVQQVQMLVMMGGTVLVMAPMFAIGGVIMAIQQEPGLSWLIAISVVVIAIFAGILVWLMMPLFRSYQERLDRVNLVMREQLTGVRVIRAFVREKLEAARFRIANDEIMHVGRRVGSIFVLMFPVAMLILNITVAAVVWFGGYAVESGEAEIGSIFAFMQYVGMILMGVLMAAFMATMIPRAMVSAERVQAVLNTDGDLPIAADPIDTAPTPGTVVFDSVGFTYPGAEEAVIKDISFTANKGETLAIVGSTGAGKTTLVSLIPRLFDVSTGSVQVGGVDVREAAPELIWKQIGLVPQKAFLFSGTVASNLRFGNADASDDELWRALEIAQGADFVRERPLGLESPISQGGTNVSGGQRQRLAIARALVHQPDVLVFDDSFSALDVTTDARLRQALWNQLPEVTKIVVAQRVTSILDADRIVVLDNGRAVGVGTHEELLETCEIYQEIVRSQLAVEA